MLPFYEKKPNDTQSFISQNLVFPSHLHSNVELLFIREGTICVEVKNKQRILKRGECALIFPEQVHRYLPAEDNRVAVIIFNPTAAGPFLRYFQNYQPECPFLSAQSLSPDIVLAIDRLLSDSVRSDSLLCNAWIQVLLANLLPLFSLKKNSTPGEPDLTLRLIQYVMEHFQEPLTLESVAKQLHVNKYYLSHTISSRLQVNFRDYLNEIRLDYAIQLMHSSNRTLTQIWGEAGFESQTSFNRIFRQKKTRLPGNTGI